MLRPRLCCLVVASALAGCAFGSAVPARACSLDYRPSAYANGQLDSLNPQIPTTSAQLSTYAVFVFARSYPVRRAITLSENRREVARSLTAAALRRPWRWEFGDGHTAYGWTVHHAYARAGQWRINVDAYDPGSRKWYNFDQVTITIHR